MLSDFMTFSKEYIRVNDADPTYPVLVKLCDQLGLDLESRIEFCFWYMAFYNLRSALEGWLNINRGDGRMTDAIANLPIKLERRGLRGGRNIRTHWQSQVEQVQLSGSWYKWATSGFQSESAPFSNYSNWEIAGNHIQQVWNNGRWAAYKGCELLEKVCGLPLRAPDMGHANSSNPRKALSLLFTGMPDKDDNSKRAIETLDEASKQLMTQCIGYDVPVNDDMALLETCCCGFYSLAKGDYYVGCDIDLMLEVAMQKDDEVREMLLKAREGVFPNEYLGELHGWTEHDKPRLKLYRDQGIIAVR